MTRCQQNYSVKLIFSFPFLIMDLRIISEVMIRPSSEVINHLQPFKLSFFDQIVPSTVFIPLVYFYPTTNAETAQFITKLKTSLSKTLSTLYPFFGRVKDNSFINNYEEGVPFTETRVMGCLKDFLKQPQLELLNQFLPYKSISDASDQEAAIPQVNIQVNIFYCGGVAIGIRLLHKITDASTASTFLNSWAAIARGSCNEKITPDIFEVWSRFPPQNHTSVKPCLSMVEKFIHNEGKSVMKRFVFDAEAIADLRAKAKSEGLDNPTRVETLSSFIWKSCMEASMLLSTSPRPFLSMYAVNMRNRLQPCLSSYSIGNLWTHGVTAYNLPDEKIKLCDLVALTRRAIQGINLDYLNALKGDEAFQVVAISLKQLPRGSSQSPKRLVFSSWLNFGFNDMDFGWGKPIWVGVVDQVGVVNSIVFKEIGWNNEDVEAWIHLDESIMSLIEQDPEFLKFASPNPSISMP